jgi:hypothetical protein
MNNLLNVTWHGERKEQRNRKMQLTFLGPLLDGRRPQRRRCRVSKSIQKDEANQGHGTSIIHATTHPFDSNTTICIIGKAHVDISRPLGQL